MPFERAEYDKLRRKRAAIRRRILIAAMGGECMDCGSTENLEFHHTEPRQWVASQEKYDRRQTLYEEDWDKGVLELLCGACNKKHGCPQGEALEFEEVPF